MFLLEILYFAVKLFRGAGQFIQSCFVHPGRYGWRAVARLPSLGQESKSWFLEPLQDWLGEAARQFLLLNQGVKSAILGI
jgi:hypothetical protein